MKKHILIFFTALTLLLSLSLYSQSPQGITYQAVVRNADGSVMASNEVVLTFMIHDGTANGAVVYQESQSLTSNVHGLVSCIVGNGSASQGNFSNINWGSGAKFLHVLMNENDLGTQQMLSVPYALYAGACDIQISLTGDTLYTGGGNFVIIPGISAANAPVNPASGLGSIVLPGNTTCSNEFINVVGCDGQTSLTYDGRIYDLVEIGGQCWFADNLATDQYRNGNPIPNGLNNSTWQNTTNGAYAIYDNSLVNDSIYGKLYNWYAVIDTSGLCPYGWHVPTDCEWMYLESSIGMSIQEQTMTGLRGNNLAGSLKSTSNWLTPNSGASNSTFFSFLPSGYRNVLGPYYGIELVGNTWTASDFNSSGAFFRSLDYNGTRINRNVEYKNLGYGIRCLRTFGSSVVLGCTDSNACNFSASVNQDDGSCLYQNASCNDGNSNTANDVINANCQCQGQVINYNCIGIKGSIRFNGSTQGPIEPAENVEICYSFQRPSNCSTWMDGIAFELGASWTNIVPSQAPANCNGGTGNWIWQTSINPTGTCAPGIISMDGGYFFDINNNGNGGDDWGDAGSCVFTGCIVADLVSVEDNSIQILAAGDGVFGSYLDCNDSSCNAHFHYPCP